MSNQRVTVRELVAGGIRGSACTKPWKDFLLSLFPHHDQQNQTPVQWEVHFTTAPISESTYYNLYLTFWPAQLKTGDVQGFWQGLGALIMLAQVTFLLPPVSQRPGHFLLYVLHQVKMFLIRYFCTYALWLQKHFPRAGLRPWDDSSPEHHIQVFL